MFKLAGLNLKQIVREGEQPETRIAQLAQRTWNFRGGDRLPWVPIDGSDNFEPLAAMTWQVHVYEFPHARAQEVVQRAQHSAAYLRLAVGL